MKLHIDKVHGPSTASGFVVDGDIERYVTIDFDGTPFEPETLTDPQVDAEVEITYIFYDDVPPDDIDLDDIENLQDASEILLEMLATFDDGP